MSFFGPRPGKLTADVYILCYSMYGYINATLTLVFVAPYRKHTAESLRWTASKFAFRVKNEATQPSGGENTESTSRPLSVRPSQEMFVIRNLPQIA